MNLVWLFGKQYRLRSFYFGHIVTMFTCRLQDCPKEGDQIITANVFGGRCQWIVESIEHRQGNLPHVHVKPYSPY